MAMVQGKIVLGLGHREAILSHLSVSKNEICVGILVSIVRSLGTPEGRINVILAR